MSVALLAAMIVAGCGGGGSDDNKNGGGSSSANNTVNSTGSSNDNSGSSNDNSGSGNSTSGSNSGAASGGDSSNTNTSPPPHQPQPKGDPLVKYQWHLINSGQTAFSRLPGRAGIDLNVASVYSSGLTGNGVKVMVIDTGVEIDHEDLAKNIDPSMLHNFGADATDAGNPTPTTNGHGTAVAGIIGAVADNGLGGRGVAPRVSLGAARLIECGDGCDQPSAMLDAFGGAPFSRNADIFNGSFGAAPTSPLSFDPLFNFEAIVLQRLENLRNGKGAIYLQAAGNEYDNNNGGTSICSKSIRAGVSCSNASFDPIRTMPQAIVVGSVNASGVRSSYSSAGSSLLISGLGGEFGRETGPAVVTTDLSGCSRGITQRQSDSRLYANDFQNPDSAIGRALNPNCKYTSTMNGTSAAAPAVAGVVALMLEANPNLTWRDVRTILMKSARRIDASRVATKLSLRSGESYVAEPAWTRNSAGLWFDNWYGFGLVDAKAAVDMARTYTAYLRTPMSVGSMAPALNNGVPVPLGSAKGAEIAVTYAGPSIGTIEAVQLGLSLNQASMGDIAIEVISPAGTRSVLQQPYNVFPNESYDVRDFALASNAFNGEPAQGTWTVRVIDVNSRNGSTPATVVEAVLRVSGH
ncbi:MAG TPA: S8 family serine peptidase [Paraburkholderia sp.]